jgi:hypothetical protein
MASSIIPCQFWYAHIFVNKLHCFCHDYSQSVIVLKVKKTWHMKKCLILQKQNIIII